MRKIGRGTVLAAAWLAALLPLAASGRASASPNLIVNPLFTTDLSGWILPSSNAYLRTWTDIVGYPGPGAVSIYSFGTGVLDTGVLRQCVGVIPGVQYAIGGYFRYVSGLGAPMYARMSFERYSDSRCDGTYLATVQSASTSTAQDKANVWQQFGVFFYVPPAGTHSIAVIPQVATDVIGTALGHLDYIYVIGTGLKPGDVNGDGSVDVADVFYLVNDLFAGGPLPVGPGDVNSDSFLDVSDAFFLINYLFAGGPVPE